MSGGVSHVDSWDPKPRLFADAGKTVSVDEFQGRKGDFKMFAKRPQWEFSRHGRCGTEVSSLFPHMAGCVDDLCVIRSMTSDHTNHYEATLGIHTGSFTFARPSIGSWVSYGLGTENSNLPAFVVLLSHGSAARPADPLYARLWGPGFLPSSHQGTAFRSGGDPVLYLSNPPGVSSDSRRDQLNVLSALNSARSNITGDPETETRIAQYELAFRMQASVPEITDLNREPEIVLEMYGPDVKRPGSFAYNCLMARKLVERGVRFVQLFHAGWDHHRNLSTQFEIQCRDTDQPSAALIKDLKQRGLLQDTLVIWGGEFGRTPFIQGNIEDRTQWGRDHHPYAFTHWMAGGGIKAGVSYGQSDEFGFNAVVDPVHVHDFQATVLHQLGIDHEKFTFKFQGRHYRLTDVHGQVVRPILNS
jgi:hypothetical protein